MNTYKIKDSLFIIGDKVISYETHVATIEGNKLIEKGKYSRTTSKHIHLVSELLGLEIVHSKKKMKGSFFKFELGVVKLNETGNAISPKSSKIILNMLREGFSYELTVAASKNKISKKDWNLLEKPETLGKDLMRGVGLLSRIDII
jgi:hypothetical protein